jgi:beta-lactamase regulating signal transducer with metallopeptidase domain
MALEPKTRLWIILVMIAAIVLAVILNPFIFSSEKTLAFFYVAEFLIVVVLWKKFNNLRITINKKELGDEKLAEIETDIENLTN